MDHNGNDGDAPEVSVIFPGTSVLVAAPHQVRRVRPHSLSLRVLARLLVCFLIEKVGLAAGAKATKDLCDVLDSPLFVC